MKKTIFILTIILFAISSGLYSQKPLIELTLTAKYMEQSVPLDGILIQNLTQGGDTMLYGADTVLILDFMTGEYENRLDDKTSFSINQNYPNPFKEKTDFSIYLHKKEYLKIIITNLIGQEVAFFNNTLEAGLHMFSFLPGTDKIYIVKALVREETKSFKMICNSNQPGTNLVLTYMGMESGKPDYKVKAGVKGFGITLGDTIRVIGYAKTTDMIDGSDVIDDIPTSNKTYTLEIIEGLPCPEAPVVIYEGQTYKTVKLGEQCWFKENLNVGTLLPYGEPTNNGIIEKYCFFSSNNCAMYGGAYPWNEMMQYTTEEGVQGICPPGWHLPTEDEFCILTQFIDPSVVCTTYPSFGGYDCAIKMKTKTGWAGGIYNQGTNESGFTGKPAGINHVNGGISNETQVACFWTSTQTTYGACDLWLHSNSPSVDMGSSFTNLGFNVRCVKD